MAPRRTRRRLALLPAKGIDERIRLIRGMRIILDADLARLYGVSTKALNQAVRRNPERFPREFALRLTSQEARAMRSQSVTAPKCAVRRLVKMEAADRSTASTAAQCCRPAL